MKMTCRASEDITERSMTELSGITYGSDGPGISTSDPLRPVLEERPERPVSAPTWVLPLKDELLYNHDLVSVAVLQKMDESYALTQAHQGPAFLLQLRWDFKIIETYKSIIECIRNKTPCPDKSWDSLEELLCKKYEFTHHQISILSREAPIKSAVRQFKKHAKEQLDDERTSYLPDDHKDYIMVGTLSKLDVMVRHFAETALGEGIYKPFLTNTIEREGTKYLYFPSLPFRITSRTLITCCLAGLFCVPVIFQVSGVVSRAGAIAAFGVVVTLGCFIMNVIFDDMKANTMLTLALAALLSNCLTSN